MTRKLVATGLAVIVSIPLIPLLEKGIERLTGTDGPMVFPAQGWSLLRERAVGSRLDHLLSEHAHLFMTEEYAISARQGDIAGMALALRNRGRVDLWQEADLSIGTKCWISPLYIGLRLPGSHSTAHPIPYCQRNYPDVASFTLEANTPEEYRLISPKFKRIAVAPVMLDELAHAAAQALPISVQHTRSKATEENDLARIIVGQDLGVAEGGLAVDAPYIVFDDASLDLSKHAAGIVAPLSCSPSSPDLNAATNCTINMTSAVPAGGAVVTLSNTSSALTVPATVTVAANATSATFSTTASSGLAVTFAQISGKVNDVGAETSVTQVPQRINRPGWYSLSVVNQTSHALRHVEVEFAPDSGGASVRYTLKDSGTGGREAGWIRLNEPGSVNIRSEHAEAKLSSMGYAEFISRAFDITLQKALLTVFLLAEILPLSAWILVVWCVRSYAYKKISLLPRLERKHARHEVDLMLNFAKWSGVSCYLLWTAKDILAGVGIVFARA